MRQAVTTTGQVVNVPGELVARPAPGQLVARSKPKDDEDVLGELVRYFEGKGDESARQVLLELEGEPLAAKIRTIRQMRDYAFRGREEALDRALTYLATLA